MVDTYITSKGCDIWGIDRLQQSDKRSFACDGNLIGQQRLFMLVTHSTNSLRSDRSCMLIQRVRPPSTAGFWPAPSATDDNHTFRARSVVNSQFPNIPRAVAGATKVESGISTGFWKAQSMLFHIYQNENLCTCLLYYVKTVL